MQAGRRRRDRSAAAGHTWSGIDRDRAGASGRLMYGGSGMWPIASIASSTEPPPSRTQTDRAAAEGVLAEHLGDEDVRRLAESRMRARLHLLARMHQRVPGVGVDLSKQQALDRAAAGIATTDQARGDDTRVVDDEQIARREERWQVARCDDAATRAPARSTTSSRDVPRSAGGACAMSSAGRSNEKSERRTIPDRNSRRDGRTRTSESCRMHRRGARASRPRTA